MNDINHNRSTNLNQVIPPVATPTSNQQFLAALFPDWRDVHVTGYTCPPEDTGPDHWKGGLASDAWREGTLERYDANQFVTVSTFRQTPDDIARRRKDLFIAQHVVMLDDLGSGVGSKSAVDLLEGRPFPTWVLETSQGNFQVGYKLSQAVIDHAYMSRFDQAMIHQGMASETDNGQAGVTRYMRMFGTNNKRKYDAPFRTRLLMWNPHLTYSIAELVEGWNLDLGTVKGATAPGTLDRSSFTYRMLSEHGHWTSPQRGDFYGIDQCPNHAEHTVSPDDGRYALNIEDGRFKCWHGHCQHINRTHLEQWLSEKYQSEYTATWFGEITPEMRAEGERKQKESEEAEWNNCDLKKQMDLMI